MPDIVLRELLGGKSVHRSEQIVLKAPALQINGALVPITVETSLANVSSITLLTNTPVEPQVASFSFPLQNARIVSTRIKLAQSSDVWSLVKAGERYFLSEKRVELESFRLLP